MNSKAIKNICAAALAAFALFNGGNAHAALLDLEKASTKTGPSAKNTTLEPPTPSASKGTYTSYVKVSWAKVTGSSGYVVKRGTTSTYANATQLMKVSGVNTLTLTDSSAVSGKTYYYWVCPYNASGAYWYNASRYASGYRGTSANAASVSLSAISVSAGTKVYVYYKSGGKYAMPATLTYNASSGCATVYRYSSLSGNACGYITTSKSGSVTVYAGSSSATLTIAGGPSYTYSIRSDNSVTVGKSISMQCYRGDGTLVDATWSVVSGGSCASIAVSTYLGHAITCTGKSAGTVTIKAVCNGYSCTKTITVSGGSTPSPTPSTGSYVSGPSSLRYGSSGSYYLYVGGKKITASSVAWSRSGLATMQDKGSYGLLKATNKPVSTNKVTVYAQYNGKRYSKTVTITK